MEETSDKIQEMKNEALKELEETGWTIPIKEEFAVFPLEKAQVPPLIKLYIETVQRNTGDEDSYLDFWQYLVKFFMYEVDTFKRYPDMNLLSFKDPQAAEEFIRKHKYHSRMYCVGDLMIRGFVEKETHTFYIRNVFKFTFQEVTFRFSNDDGYLVNHPIKST